MQKRELAVQLYTLREETKRDFPGTLRQVADAGYSGVEFAGYGSHTPAELRGILDELGMVTAGCHIGLALLESNLDQAINDVHTLGARHLACPFLPEDRRTTADDYRKVGETLSEIGRKCKEAGLQLSYHNHAFEFQQFDGRTGFDILFEAADPDLVKMQLDLGWVVVAGHDGADFLRQYTGRVPTVHFKDLSKDPNQFDAPVGEGKLPVPELIAAARDAGAEWLIVEQDHPQGSPVDCVTRSAAFMRQQGVV